MKKLEWKEKETLYITDRPLKEVIAELQGYLEQYGDNVEIGCGIDYDDREYLFLLVGEPETDQEYHSRIKREELNRRALEKQERKEFERLAKKFMKPEGVRNE